MLTRAILQFGTGRLLLAHVDLFVSEAIATGEAAGAILVVQTTRSAVSAARTAALAAGLLIGIFQAATQINEVTLSFIPKLLVLAATLYIGGGWMLKVLIGYSESLIKSIPQLIG